MRPCSRRGGSRTAPSPSPQPSPAGGEGKSKYPGQTLFPYCYPPAGVLYYWATLNTGRAAGFAGAIFAIAYHLFHRAAPAFTPIAGPEYIDTECP